jgi:hypothetical protein
MVASASPPFPLLDNLFNSFKQKRTSQSAPYLSFRKTSENLNLKLTMMRTHSIFRLIFSTKVKPNILKREQLQRKKEQAVYAKKLNASKCTVNASLQESTAHLNAHATVATIINKVKP